MIVLPTVTESAAASDLTSGATGPATAPLLPSTIGRVIFHLPLLQSPVAICAALLVMVTGPSLMFHFEANPAVAGVTNRGLFCRVLSRPKRTLLMFLVIASFTARRAIDMRV